MMDSYLKYPTIFIDLVVVELLMHGSTSQIAFPVNSPMLHLINNRSIKHCCSEEGSELVFLKQFSSAAN